MQPEPAGGIAPFVPYRFPVMSMVGSAERQNLDRSTHTGRAGST
jgi:hypothetical protein